MKKNKSIDSFKSMTIKDLRTLQSVQGGKPTYTSRYTAGTTYGPSTAGQDAYNDSFWDGFDSTEDGGGGGGNPTD